ncbi:MAG: Crp/Fnr family transcriptional regulator [Bacteroidetes bacterium]|nr:Crp/Fnr family transcriptional regulator [Bacteroidota bacterium]MBU1718683.1 Crp/Fnr family transcriptional regulator [Bacteroidota bacterium]
MEHNCQSFVFLLSYPDWMEEPKKICECRQCEFRSVVFNNLSGDEISLICLSKRDKSFVRGEMIIREGQEISEFLYLKRGLVKLFKMGAEGKDQIINIAKPFDFVSLLSVFSDTHYNFSIAAIDDSTVCIIDLSVIKEMIEKNGKFALRIMEKLSQSSDKIIHNNIQLNQKQLRGRIAYILLFFSNEIFYNKTFDLPVSRKEIAQLIDMTTENVIRIFSEFRRDNLISISGKTIEILNPEMLKRISAHG